MKPIRKKIMKKMKKSKISEISLIENQKPETAAGGFTHNNKQQKASGIKDIQYSIALFFPK